MGRFPFINLCFVLFLMGIFATRHLVPVIHPTANGFRLVDYDAQPKPDDFAAQRPMSTTIQRSLKMFIGDLSDLWERAMIMRLWMLEYQTTYWTKAHATTGAEADLLEARFHVANAEVFDAAMNQQSRAKIELKRAESSITETRPLIEARARVNLELIEQEIGAVSINPKTARVEESAPYEKIKSDLDRLIERLRVAKT